MTKTLYKYRPASAKALALLVRADIEERKTTTYFAEILRALLTGKKYDMPSLTDYLKPRKAAMTNAEQINAAVDTMFRVFGGGGKNEDCDA